MLLHKLTGWQKRYKQESMGYEYEGDLYYVKTAARQRRKKRK
jgi:hypothetical protein